MAEEKGTVHDFKKNLGIAVVGGLVFFQPKTLN